MRKHLTKCSFTVLTVLMLTLCFCSAGSAQATDIDSMSYDELTALKTEVDTRIAELERQYAIENGNRIIRFDCEQLTLFEKQKQPLTPSVERIVDEAPESTDFVWTTSDETVAKVSSSGNITAIAEGTAVITCTAADDPYIFSELPVTVVARVSGLTLSNETLELRLSEKDAALGSAHLSATIEPETAFCQEVTWSSSDETVATVDTTGVVTAVFSGNATITAVSNEEVAKGQKPRAVSCKVTVVKDVDSLVLEQTTLKIQKGKTEKLAVTVLPQDADNPKVTWESSAPEIASVSNGQITAKSCGSCTITCTAADDSKETVRCNVTVYQPVTGIKPSQKEVTAFIGENAIQVETTLLPEDATDKNVEWISDDPTVATVDKQGNITALAGGECTITCTALDGSEKQAQVSVIVPSISVEKTDWVVTKKDGLSIPLRFYGKDISDLNITVSSKKVLSVQKHNSTKNACEIRLTPNAAGKVTITLKDANNEKCPVKLNVEVAHSAVYDSISYPKASYKEILRYPSDYLFKKVQIYGKVLQKLSSGSKVVLRVGTSGRWFYDSVFYVTYSTSNIDISVIEDDYITIYGRCAGTETYESVMGNEITIPAISAEKIIYGK